MEIGHDDWGYLRSLAGILAEASDLSRGDYVHLTPQWVDGVVKRLREITDKPHPVEAKPQAQRREKRG